MSGCCALVWLPGWGGICFEVVFGYPFGRDGSLGRVVGDIVA